MNRDTPSMNGLPYRLLIVETLPVVLLPIERRVAWLPMRAETLKGHLDGILLAVLEPEPRHGYSIMEALRVRSGGPVDLPTGTVYPALHRLEHTRLGRVDQPAGSRRKALHDRRCTRIGIYSEYYSSASSAATLGNAVELAVFEEQASFWSSPLAEAVKRRQVAGPAELEYCAAVVNSAFAGRAVEVTSRVADQTPFWKFPIRAPEAMQQA